MLFLPLLDELRTGTGDIRQMSTLEFDSSMRMLVGDRSEDALTIGLLVVRVGVSGPPLVYLLAYVLNPKLINGRYGTEKAGLSISASVDVFVKCVIVEKNSE